ncbi:MAG: alpha/beta hydrolase, partial [Desulfuromonadaceae bacterium]
YAALKRELDFNVHFPDWPEYRNEVTYQDIAERIVEENGINDGDIVGGSSLGGMVALEIATIVKVRAVLLIGSAMAKNDINTLITLLSPLAAITPISLVKTLAGKNESLVSQMFSTADPDFIRSMCGYISSWPGYLGNTDKVFRIHGEKDPIINCPPSRCEIVKKASHLLALTHAKECSAFIEKINLHLSGQADTRETAHAVP